MLGRNGVVGIALLAIGIYFLKWYMNGEVCRSTDRVDGKIVLVTGANTGIGKETVEDLVSRGAKVYMACRSMDRGLAAANDIKSRTNVDDSRLIVLHLDLNSLQSVRDFASEFKKREKRLDILINNAGVMFVPEGKTVDGFETTFGVNHLGHFLLTHLLADLLISNEKPTRIITVSSAVHSLIGAINFDDLMFAKSYDTYKTYFQSKLANILFTRELAERLQGTNVTTYSLHPGGIRTELMRNWALLHDFAVVGYVFNVVSWPFMKEPWYGAQTTICCAVDSGLESHTGKYYSECVETEPSAAAQDNVAAKKLWDVSVSLVKLQPSEIHQKLR